MSEQPSIPGPPAGEPSASTAPPVEQPSVPTAPPVEQPSVPGPPVLPPSAAGEQGAVGDPPSAPASPEPLPEILGSAQEPRRVHPKLIAAVSGALALAVVAGLGVLAFDRLGDADRTAPTVVWVNPPQRPENPAAEPTGLAAKLPPVPYQYRLGPDVDGLGNNTVLGRKQAVVKFKEGTRGLTPAQRKARDRAIDKLRLQGLAARSYVSLDQGLIVEMSLAQIENAKDGRKLAGFQSEFAEAFGVLRKGPTVPGFKNAKCFLTPKSSETKFDAMFCSAYEGDVLVNVYAYGLRPLGTASATELLRLQLEHLESPGESV
ncbi:hypothetical protein ABZY19_37265 [Streptomyces sp. NPDC006475]|uniref:hypothetical protein n=1 Tax=Streptomyces sp. NPDC006475 TaxID=3155719 RepID=UPI0033A3B71D